MSLCVGQHTELEGTKPVECANILKAKASEPIYVYCNGIDCRLSSYGPAHTYTLINYIIIINFTRGPTLIQSFIHCIHFHWLEIRNQAM